MIAATFARISVGLVIYFVAIMPRIVYAMDPFDTKGSVSVSPAKNMIAPDSHVDPCRFGNIGTALSLGEAIERALCSNPMTRRAWANSKMKAAQLGVSQAAYLPTVNAAYSGIRNSGSVEVAGLPQFNSQASTNTRDRSLNLSWVLFDFGLRSANLAAARHLLAAADAAHDATLQSVLIVTAQAYYDLLSAQGALEASRESEYAAKQSFLAADAKYQAGVGALADKLQAQTTYGQTTLNRVKADRDAKTLQGVLAIAMGLSPASTFALSTENTALPTTEFLKDVTALIEEAKQQHPTLIAAHEEMAAAKANAAALKAEGLPTIALIGSLSRNDGRGQFPVDSSTRSKNIGVQVRIPIFEGFGRSYRVQAATAQVDVKAADLSDAELNVSLEVWRTYQSLTAETENLHATENLLQSANQSFNVAQGRYKAGVGSILELLNAQSQLADAKQQRVKALSNWRTARLNLAGSLGNLGMWAIR